MPESLSGSDSPSIPGFSKIMVIPPPVTNAKDRKAVKKTRGSIVDTQMQHTMHHSRTMLGTLVWKICLQKNFLRRVNSVYVCVKRDGKQPNLWI